MITKSWHVGWEYCEFYAAALIVQDVYTNTYSKVMVSWYQSKKKKLIKCYLDMPDGFFQHSLGCCKKNVYFG